MDWMEEGRGAHRVLVGETRGKETIGGDQDVDGRIILRWILRKCERVYGLDGGRETCA
jgi:hypothetical protein